MMRWTGMRMGRRQRGFTLLEVLIAVTITGLIGLGTYQLFNSTLRTQATMEERSSDLEKLQRAMAIIGRDFQQLAARPIRNGFGDQEYAITNRNSLYLVEFTRFGWRNPLGDARSDMQRVSYELREDNRLVRYFYRVLDRAQDSQPVTQYLLTDVESFTIRFLDNRNQWHEEWPTNATLDSSSMPETVTPPEEGDGQETTGGTTGPDSSLPKSTAMNALPKALEIKIEHRRFGTLTRLFDVAGAI